MNDDTRHRVLHRDAALADGRTDRLRHGVSILVEGDRIAWIRPTDAEEDPGRDDGLEIVDAGALVHGDPLADPSALWRVWRVAWAPDPLAV